MELLFYYLFGEHSMNYAIAPVVLGGLLAAGGSVLGGSLNYFGQKAANKQNAEIAAKQRAFDLEMWNKNNAYNTPLAQMARLKEAGLNPNLIYGSGSASTGLSSSYPKATTPVMQNEFGGLGQGVSSALGQFYDIKMKEAQINAINNNADLTLQKTANEAYKKYLMQSQTAKNEWDVKRGTSLLPYQTTMFEQNNERIRLGNQDLTWKLKDKNPLEVAQMLKRNALLEAETRSKNFLNTYILPKQSAKMNADLALKKQQLLELNPVLLDLRLAEKNLKSLKFEIESRLAPYNMNSSTPTIFKLLPNLFENSPKRKDVLFNW